MQLLTASLAVAAITLTSPVYADEALAKKHNCMSCHQLDKKSVGPAYQDVGKKYKGQSDAAVRLAAKVKKGGAGVWGQIPMPPNPTVPDVDIKRLVDWVLKTA